MPAWIALALLLAGGGLSGVLYLLLERARADRDLARLEARNTREQLAAVGAAAVDAQAREKGTLHVLEGGLAHERAARAAAARLDDASARSFLVDELRAASGADDPPEDTLPGAPPAAPAPGRKPGDLN